MKYCRYILYIIIYIKKNIFWCFDIKHIFVNKLIHDVLISLSFNIFNKNCVCLNTYNNVLLYKLLYVLDINMTKKWCSMLLYCSAYVYISCCAHNRFFLRILSWKAAATEISLSVIFLINYATSYNVTVYWMLRKTDVFDNFVSQNDSRESFIWK